MQAMFNHGDMLERLGGDAELLHEIVTLFRSECPKMIGEVREAVEAADSDQLHRAAHALKGALLNIAADPVAEKARVLESCGRQGALDGAVGLFDELESAIDRLQAELAAVEP